MIGLNVLLVNYKKGARRARTVHSAEGPLHKYRCWNLSSLQGLVSSRCKRNDRELSEEAWAVKIRWFEKVLARLLKLQSRIASSATSNVQPPMSGNVQPSVSHSQHSSSATTHAVPPFFSTPPVSIFFVAWKDRSAGEKSTDRRQFWNFCIEETWRRGTVAPKRACGRFRWKQKPSFCLLMILMYGFLARPAKIHPKPFATVQRHRCCLSQEFWIVGCFVYHWSCCLFPGNIASNAISRSLGRSGWFIASQRLIDASRIGTSPYT